MNECNRPVRPADLPERGLTLALPEDATPGRIHPPFGTESGDKKCDKNSSKTMEITVTHQKPCK